MGTRSIVLLTNGKKTHRVYRHYDGYPTAQLQDLYNSIKGKRAINQVLKAYICINNDFKAHLEESFTEKLELTKKHLGNQSDLEWIYIVDTKNKNIDVYRGGYTGKSPQSHVKRGLIEPMSYVENIRDEYKDAEKRVINNAVFDLLSIGYTVNKGVNNANEKAKK